MTQTADSAATFTPTTASVIRAWIVTLAAGIAAAMITWAAAESLLTAETGTAARGGAIPISPVVHSTRNGMTGLGLLGGTLGLGLGLAGGLLRGSARAAALAALVGAVMGGATGVGAAKALVPVYFSNYSGVSLSVPLLVHGGLWLSIAIAAGVAFGLGIGGRGRVIGGVINAMAGALLATFTYEFAGVWLFPLAQTDRPLPLSSSSRLFAYLVIAIIVAGSLALGVSRGRSTKDQAAPGLA